MGSGDCFDTSRVYMYSLSRVENKIHIINFACGRQIICVLCSLNLQKQTPIFFLTEGRAPGAPVLDPHLMVLLHSGREICIPCTCNKPVENPDLASVGKISCRS